MFLPGESRLGAGCLVSACQKAGPELAVMPSHAVSAKSLTLKNKAFPVIDHHDLSQEMPLVGDEGLEPPTSSV